ncbi:hypothetical protein GH714_002432 [Hevea brasiliensis]|uniref:1,3-beta-glucan synthase n=1 Tax=Hevea brasiliensis TaxID=3981 RepID=A0A6A6L8F9_HEVBR|nr:hypothetical protein GH714_002432 [Hevea brasiliensis]
MTLVKKLRDAIHRFRLRYGLGQPYKKIESSQVEATTFALIWNEIITTFREEDIISDQEHELLELPPNYWNIRVIRWPCVLLCNELLLALKQAQELADAPDRWIWLKISKSEYRRCAVIEAYDSIKYLVLTVVKYHTEEHSIAERIFDEIDNNIQFEKVTEAYNLKQLESVHSKLISFVEVLMGPKKDLKRSSPHSASTDEGLLFENAIEFPDAEDELFNRHVRRLYTILNSRDSMHNVPKNIEARRRIAFFSNSLFMNMPRAPVVEKMMAFSVLTPYYEEEVCFPKETLRRQNEDGISTIFYLQKIYEDEWNNFIERMYREGMKDDDDIWEKKSRDLRLWASYRGQTLARTVRGMMYYYRALKMLSYLDTATEIDIRMGTQELASHHSSRQNRSLDGLNSQATIFAETGQSR